MSYFTKHLKNMIDFIKWCFVSTQSGLTTIIVLIIFFGGIRGITESLKSKK